MPLLNSRGDDKIGNLVEGPSEKISRGSAILSSIRKSFRKRKQTVKKIDENPKPNEWLEDVIKVKQGTCQFKVKFLGVLEVTDSRGIAHCEEAVKRHKQRKERNKKRAILCISPETIRLVKEKNKQLIIDQTIEKVSFCAPDSNYENAFSYICREGTTKRWMCYSFLAITDTGERLSHAVGTAFKACLIRKKELEKANMAIVGSLQETTFDIKETPEIPESITPIQSLGENGDNRVSKVDENICEIKSLPRPQAPEYMKRQASLRAFVPSPKQNAFKTLPANSFVSDKIQQLKVLNPVPEYEGSGFHIPVQTVQPFNRIPTRSTISCTNQAYREQRKMAQPIREDNPWSNSAIIRSRTEPVFSAFDNQRTPSKKTPIIASSKSFQCENSPGDVWMESLKNELAALKAGEESEKDDNKKPPIIPQRKGMAALPHRNRAQNISSRSAGKSLPIYPNMPFTRSQSVRYDTSGYHSKLSSSNPFQEAAVDVSRDASLWLK